MDPTELKRILTYCPNTGIFIWNISFRGYTANRVAGCVSKHTGYRYICYKGKNYLAHRLAWLWMTGQWPENLIDHINKKTDDNSWDNLRLGTKQKNAQNLKVLPKGYYKQGNKYITRIRSEGINRIVGSYDTEVDAHNAYLIAKRKYHDFFIDE
jgi:hypothetical protein